MMIEACTISWPYPYPTHPMPEYVPPTPIDFMPMTFPATAPMPMDFGHQCEHCGMWHQGRCSRIKAIEYYKDGTVKRVEYHDPMEAFKPTHAEATA